VRLRELQQQGKLGVPTGDYVASCIQMHINRLLAVDQSGDERTIWKLLTRWYESQCAREVAERG
jgi:hypothetical protein